MYGKFFASAFTGSMLGAGAEVFALWAYIIAHTHDSIVEVNPVHVGQLIGMPTAEVEAAVAFLCAPDPRSRSNAEEGRRLLPESGFSYRVVNFESYRGIKNEDERREYNRQAQQRHRDKASRPVKARVNDSQTSQQMSNGVKRRQQTSSQTETEPEPITTSQPKGWVGEAVGIWKASQGLMAPGRIGKALKPAVDTIGPEETIRRFRVFADGKDGKFGPEYFTSRFQNYSAPQPGDFDPSAYSVGQP